jgi:hypothetical protein
MNWTLARVTSFRNGLMTLQKAEKTHGVLVMKATPSRWTT